MVFTLFLTQGSDAQKEKMLPSTITTRQVAISVALVLAAILCLVFLPWHNARNALAAGLGLVAVGVDASMRDRNFGVGFLKGVLVLLIIGMPLSPTTIDRREWYTLQPLLTFIATQAAVLLAIWVVTVWSKQRRTRE